MPVARRDWPLIAGTASMRLSRDALNARTGVGVIHLRTELNMIQHLVSLVNPCHEQTHSCKKLKTKTLLKVFCCLCEEKVVEKL